ncbi:MAG: YecA family protein [Vicinamibacterales bacterium]
MATTPGRNDPCPCGSGRKFKQCCLWRDNADVSARMRIRRSEGQVVEGVLSFITRRFGPDYVRAAWNQFFLWQDVPEDMTGTEEFDPMFIPWLTTLYVPEPYDDFTKDEEEKVSDPDWPQVPAAVAWAAEEPAGVDDHDLEWIRVATRSPMSAFVVEAVDPGRSVDIRDILTGRRFHVLEQTASRSLEKHGVAFTRVITMDGVSVMFGMAPWVIGPEWHNTVIDWRQRTLRGRTMSRAGLEEWAGEIQDLYLEIVARMLNPAPPQLQNTDGDPIALTTLTFDVSCSVDDAATRLAHLATLPGVEPDDAFDEVERHADGRMSRVVMSWKKAGNKKHKSWDNTILGHLQLSDGRLVIEVNSDKRADKVIREVARALKGEAVLVSREATGVAARMAERSAEPEAIADQDVPEPTAEVVAFEEEMFRRHMEEWVDTKVPALGNKTPRAAAKTPLGRERLSALIASFETRGPGLLPNGRRILDELRRTLGLEVPLT